MTATVLDRRPPEPSGGALCHVTSKSSSHITIVDLRLTMASSAKTGVWKTGGNVDNIAWELLGHAYDKDENVRMSISRSLQAIGNQQPDLVVSGIAEFIRRVSSKGPQALDIGHRVQLLRTLAAVCEDVRDRLPLDLATSTVQFAGSEMVASKESMSDWQGAACAVLVALSVRFPDALMDTLMTLFKPGNVPHYFVIKCLADFAAANPISFTIRLKEVLSRVIPVLGSVKEEPMKWAFTTALGRFAEAVTHFQINADPSQKAAIPQGAFGSDMNMAFDVIFNNWLNSKELKVRLAVLESLGAMSSLLTRDHFDAELMKLLPIFLGMYKKEAIGNHLPVSQGLCAVFEVAVSDGRYALEPQLPLILGTLHPLIAVPIDYKQPSTVKNHNEMLRCFEILARTFQDQVLTFITHRLQAKEAPVRFSSLVLVRHLVNACDKLLVDKKPFLLASLQVLLDEQSYRVRKALMQVIVGMAENGYLTLEGGQALIAFLVRQAAISQLEINSWDQPTVRQREMSIQFGEEVTPMQLRHAADHILNVLTTKLPDTHKVLYPALLEFIRPPQLQSALGTIARCVNHIITAHQGDAKFPLSLDFDRLVNLPKPQLIFIRFLLALNTPREARWKAELLLPALSTLAPYLQPVAGTVCCEHIPALQEFLQDDSLPLTKWEDYVLRLFKEIVASIDSEGWLVEFVENLCSVYETGGLSQPLKRVVLRYLGATLASVRSRDFIKVKIDWMLDHTNNHDDCERQGCAQGLGLAGKNHLDLVLEKLVAVLKRVEGAKKGGFFGIGESDDSKQSEQIRSTIALCLGYVTAYASPDLVSSRVELHVVSQMTPLMATAKTPMLREQLIKALDLIGKSLHSSRLPKPLLLRQRDELLRHTLVFLHEANQSPPMRVLGVNACATLINLEPALPAEVKKALLDEVLPYTEIDEVKCGDEVAELTLQNLNAVLSSLVHMEPTLPLLVSLLQRVEHWVVSSRSKERERACQSYLVLLKKFISKITVEKVAQKETSLVRIGDLLATLIPRCTDSRLVIRTCAVECVQALLYIDQVLKNPTDSKPSQDVLLCTQIRTRMESENATERLAVARDLASLLAQMLSPEELPLLLKRAISGSLNDPDPEAGLGSAHVLQTLFELRGAELTEHVPVLLTSALASLSKMLLPGNIEQTLNAVRRLALGHFQATMLFLTALPMPLSSEAFKVFGIIAKTPELVMQLLNSLLSTLNDSPFSEEKPVMTARAATAALNEVLKLDAVHETFNDYFAPLLCTLLLRVGSSFGVDTGASSDEAVEAIQTLFWAAKETSVIEKCKAKDVFAVLKTKDYEIGVANLIQAICSERPQLMRGLFEYLLPFLSRIYVGHRAVATAVISQFIQQSQHDMPLLRKSISVLLPRVADKLPRVRRQALIGVGNLIAVWNAEVQQQSSSIMSALMAAMEDSVDVVASQAVQSTILVAEVVDDVTMASMLVNICFRMRPAFDRSEQSIRSAACTLFGTLTRFGSGAAAENFMDQLHTNVPIYLVHLNDESETVRKTCREGFIRVVKVLDVPEITAAVEEFSGDPSDYDNFIETLAPLIVKHQASQLGLYLQSLVSYFRSAWPVVRGNAAIVVGQLLRCVEKADRRRFDVQDLCGALVQLLGEGSPLVRAKGAKALSFLHDV